ncbi:MAG: serine protease [Bacteroidota bacterium]
MNRLARTKRVFEALFLQGLAFLVAAELSGCSASSPPGGAEDRAPLPERDGAYDAGFPNEGLSEYLEGIGESIKMVSCVAYYRVYPFDEGDSLRASDITPGLLEEQQDRSFFTNTTSSGTGTVIYFDGFRVALLTCAHVVSFPDTLLAHHYRTGDKPTPFVRSVSVKEKQSTYVAVFPEGGDMEILALDARSDCAILGKEFKKPPSRPIRELEYPFGEADELGWGALVYIFGYPSGQQMLTRGIVSRPRRGGEETFFLDAVLGPGYSGAPAMALRDGVPNFECVGLVTEISGQKKLYIVPEETVEYEPGSPYEGDIYIRQRTDLAFGVSQAVSAEAVDRFLQAHRNELAGRGYPVQLRRRSPP